MPKDDKAISAIFVPIRVADSQIAQYASRSRRAPAETLCLAPSKPLATTGRWICVLPKDHEGDHG